MGQMSLTIKKIILRIIPDRADDTGVVEGAHGPSIFV